MEEKTGYLLRANDMFAKPWSFSHPWNPNSLVIGDQLAAKTGLQRVGVNIVRIPPGKESFTYHSHQREEEWIYILSGKAIAEIDGVEYEVSQGDFMGFPAPGIAHHLRNPFEEELIYLVGGENLELEVADFPKLGKRMIRYSREKVEIFDSSDERGFGPLEKKE